MRPGYDLGKLRKATPAQYLSRFAFGCVLTLIVMSIAKWAGPIVGGLFLAFPGIYPPGSSYVEKKEEERKSAAGLHGTRRARALASAHAVGSSVGTFGLMVFAAAVWKGLPRFGLGLSLLAGTIGWCLASFGAWWLRERL